MFTEEKYSVNMLLTCTLYYDAWPDYLISSIRTVCKYRKCSFLTGLITSLTDLVQAYHQGQIGTSKTKSTGSPFHIPITLLSEFFCFALTESFSVLAESLFAGYLEVHQKYSTARHIFKSLLSVQKCGQTWSFCLIYYLCISMHDSWLGLRPCQLSRNGNLKLI